MKVVSLVDSVTVSKPVRSVAPNHFFEISRSRFYGTPLPEKKESCSTRGCKWPVPLLGASNIVAGVGIILTVLAFASFILPSSVM